MAGGSSINSRDISPAVVATRETLVGGIRLVGAVGEPGVTVYIVVFRREETRAVRDARCIRVLHGEVNVLSGDGSRPGRLAQGSVVPMETRPKVVDSERDGCSRHHSGDRISASNVANIFQTRDSEGRRTEEDRRADESRIVSLEANLTRSEDVNCKVHRVGLPKIGCDGGYRTENR